MTGENLLRRAGRGPRSRPQQGVAALGQQRHRSHRDHQQDPQPAGHAAAAVEQQRDRAGIDAGVRETSSAGGWASAGARRTAAPGRPGSGTRRSSTNRRGSAAPEDRHGPSQRIGDQQRGCCQQPVGLASPTTRQASSVFFGASEGALIVSRTLASAQQARRARRSTIAVCTVYIGWRAATDSGTIRGPSSPSAARVAMNLHEYQSKKILASYGVPVPDGRVAASAEEAVAAAAHWGARCGCQGPGARRRPRQGRRRQGVP